MSYPLTKWYRLLVVDEALNDSDKAFTVPANTQWHIMWIWVELTTTADAGNRQLAIEVQDPAADVIARPAMPRVTQAASLTYNYQFGPSLAQDLAVYATGADNYVCTPIPPSLILETGDIVRVYDFSAVQVAADDMIVQMQVMARSMI